MRILERRTYLGPNLYAHFRVIRFLLDLGPLEEYPSAKIPGFVDRLVALLPGLSEHVQIATCATPRDFERRIGLAEGGLHGISQDLAHTTVFRPSNKSKSIQGLYLAGSSTNPGGGVPTVIASGAIAASLVQRHEF